MFRLFREAVEARIRAEDEARAEQRRAERAEARVAELMEQIVADKNRIIDVLSRRAIGTNMYAENEAPSAGFPTPISESAHRRLGREEQRERMKQFTASLMDYRKNLSDSNTADILDDAG